MITGLYCQAVSSKQMAGVGLPLAQKATHVRNRAWCVCWFPVHSFLAGSCSGQQRGCLAVSHGVPEHDSRQREPAPADSSCCRGMCAIASMISDNDQHDVCILCVITSHDTVHMAFSFLVDVWNEQLIACARNAMACDLCEAQGCLFQNVITCRCF